MKKTVAKYLCIILSAALLLTALPLTVYAEDSVFNVSTAEQLSDAYTAINNGNGGEYTINLEGNIDNGAIVIKNPDAVVTVNGNGYAITNHRNAVNVSDGAKVILGDGNSTLTLQGSVDPHEIPVGNDEPGLICVLYGSTCTMSANVTLKNHKGDNYLGGGVTVEGGTFVMNGGNIDNCGIGSGSVCYGGGVAVYNGGCFEMNGGSITNCYAISDYEDDYDPNRCFTAIGGGVFVTGGSSFTMNGGTISGCEATNMGGGVAQIISYNEMQKYGMGTLKSMVTINDGTISGNKAGNGAGVFSSGYFYWDSTKIKGHGSGGIGTQPNPGLYINGGKINQNEADGSGGGVFIAMLRPNTVVLHNAEITKNKAYDGAGIDIFGYWTNTDIDNCTITDNVAESNGGGLEITRNSSGGQTFLKNTTITGNESGGRGAGVYYDSNSKLTISGANIIQDNYYNNVLNNLNIFSQAKPVYVNGELTGSKVGLSDPTLWGDGKEDTDPEAVSTDYLTSGYKTNNSNLSPSAAFTSDHESWFVDYSDINENEVRLVRKKPNYHINNADIAANAKYGGDDIFTSYVEAATKEIKVGDTIEEFYTIPEVTPTATNSCPYIFKGWYYDKDNDNDSNPVRFGTDKYSKDIYAHWIKVEGVEKDADDDNNPPKSYNNIYGGFDLAGVQVREGIRDTNFDGKRKPGGLRFVTSLNMDIVREINAIKPNNIEYGYVAATAENAGWINYHHAAGRKLQYVSKTANGINTSASADKESYFDFASNINCTSRRTNPGGIVKDDHRNFDGYLLYTLVITYEDVDDSAKGKNVLARPYIKYSDANGLERVAYSEYRGNSNTLGGCYTSYTAIAGNN